jgi:hypothetical protein
MNPLAELRRLDGILGDWSPHGPADDRYYDAKEIVRKIDAYIETHLISDYAAGKIGSLQSDLDDLYYRDGKNRKRVAPFGSLLESARRYVATLAGAFPASNE